MFLCHVYILCDMYSTFQCNGICGICSFESFPFSFPRFTPEASKYVKTCVHCRQLFTIVTKVRFHNSYILLKSVFSFYLFFYFFIFLLVYFFTNLFFYFSIFTWYIMNFLELSNVRQGPFKTSPHGWKVKFSLNFLTVSQEIREGYPNKKFAVHQPRQFSAF